MGSGETTESTVSSRAERGGEGRHGRTADAVDSATSRVTRESDEPVATAHGGGRAHMNLVRTSARKLVFLYVAAVLFGIRPAEYTGLVKPYVDTRASQSQLSQSESHPSPRHAPRDSHKYNKSGSQALSRRPVTSAP